MGAWQMRTFWLTLTAVLLGIAGVGFVVYRLSPGRQAQANPDTRVTIRPPGNMVKFKSADIYGIEASPVQSVPWHPKIFVDGRVLANPHATLEVRAPFAGIVSAERIFRIGASVKATEKLALFEARFSPLEKLDLKAKSFEAEARYRGAEDVLKIRKERIDRLGTVESGSISLGNRDEAAVQFFEARTQKDIALTQWNLWKQALESVGKKNIVVPINAPISGEIAEIGAQPGANVEAGQLLVRLVDFNQVLVRLDFPSTNADAPPPDEIDIETPSSLSDAATRWPARLRGSAPTIEVGSQKASYLYELVRAGKTAATWRPGLYVRAILNDPAAKVQPAKAIPASALLAHLGRTWVYVELEPGRYKRLEVELLGRARDTFYVAAAGWQTADTMVVSRHAQILLSEEFRSDVDDD